MVYAALWEAYRVSWQMSSGGPGSGLFKSTDGGETWTETHAQAGAAAAGVVGKIGVVGLGCRRSNRVYAIVEHEDGGVFQSDDAGETWTRVNDDRRLRQRAFYYSPSLRRSEGRRTRVYVLNTGFYKSHRWRQDLHDDRLCRTATTTTSGSIPATRSAWSNSNDGGGNVSVNGGDTWTGQGYPTAQLYHVATTRDVPYHVCGAQQDNTHVVRAERRGGASSAIRGSRPATGSTRSAAARAATSPRIRPIPTSSSPAARARCSPGTTARTGHIRDVQVVSAVLLRRAGERAEGTLAVDVPDRLLARTTRRALHVVAARVEDDERRAGVGRPSAAT